MFSKLIDKCIHLQKMSSFHYTTNDRKAVTCYTGTDCVHVSFFCILQVCKRLTNITEKCFYMSICGLRRHFKNILTLTLLNIVPVSKNTALVSTSIILFGDLHVQYTNNAKKVKNGKNGLEASTGVLNFPVFFVYDV